MTKPSTQITTEYLMTLHAPLQEPQRVGDDLLIYNCLSGGWVKGPAISGEIVPPSGDWLRVLPNGTSELDVRVSIKADDGSFIFVKYGGRIAMPADAAKRLEAGESLGSDDLYFITSPTFETSSEKYGWLNDIVAVGKIVSCAGGPDSHVTYDLFVVR